MKMKKYFSGALALVALMAATSANAGIVVMPTSYSSSHIVFDNTDTTLIGGVTFASSGTYDGIAFSQWTGNVSTSKALSAGVSAVATASYGTNRTGLGGDQQYATVTYTSGNAPGSLTISGLDSSKSYHIQYGFQDGRNGSYPYHVTATLTLSDTTNATTDLSIGASGTSDDYALILATVSGTTSLKLDLPTSTFNGVGSIFNAFSVHETIPEPSAALLGGMGLLGMLTRRRRA